MLFFLTARAMIYILPHSLTSRHREFHRYRAVHVETDRWYLLYVLFGFKKKKKLNAKEINLSFHIL